VIPNAAISGSHTADWLPTAANGSTFGLSENCYNNALAIIAAAGGVDYVMVMLGTNDAAEDIAKAAYQSNLSVLCDALIAQGMKVILNYPGVAYPGFDQYLPLYWSAINTLVDNVNIFLGDTEFPAFCANNRSYFSEQTVHPNYNGQFALGLLHAVAASKVIDGGASGSSSSSGASITFPAAEYVYAGVNRGDGTLGTLHASNIAAAAGMGVNLSAAILLTGNQVDDVVGQANAGGGGGSSTTEAEILALLNDPTVGLAAIMAAAGGGISVTTTNTIIENN
jgi:hypothetical protein